MNYDEEFIVNVLNITGTQSKRKVYASCRNDAWNIVEADPTVRKVLNVEHAKQFTPSSSGFSWGLIFILILMVGFIMTMPWSSMLGLGILGAKLTEFIVGDEFNDAVDKDRNVAALFILIVALTSGGFGFVKGIDLKEYIDSSDTPIENVNSVKEIIK